MSSEYDPKWVRWVDDNPWKAQSGVALMVIFLAGLVWATDTSRFAPSQQPRSQTSRSTPSSSRLGAGYR